MNETIYDVYGNTIWLGDVVAYPTRRGSTLAMTIGNVEAIEGGKLKIRRNRERANYANESTYIPSNAPIVTVSPRLAVVVG